MLLSEEGLTIADFERLRALIYRESGISLGPEKKTMLEIRLKRRLRDHTCETLEEYCAFVFGRGRTSEELVHLIDAVTTNKTDFFREPGHFEYLASHALPEILRRRGTGRRSLFWSAGCSTGEEPYTLAMILNDYAQNAPGFRYSIIATDICTQVLAKAAAGIYKSEQVRPVPAEMRRKYLMRSRDPNSSSVRVVPELRAQIEFRRLNFVDTEFGLSEPAEVIFCRNVIIYFDRPTQVRILQKLIHHLSPGGYFFAGHSESLQGMELPLTVLGPSVYRKRE